MLRADYREEEVYRTLSQMHHIKAPGLDGICPMFFQTYWHIVGHSATQMVMGILKGAPIPTHLNRTFITLILKKSNTVHMADFRPISLCNVVYKLVSKVLANRLKSFFI